MGCNGTKKVLGVSDMLQENQQGFDFGTKGQREVKYTINLGKLLSTYKVVIIDVFYRFAM